ncbi:MAG: hypothetical protein VYC91_04815 [Acidobacteriota bacterium]|nr:hypothetical protein [Acidobacteriota bacterium]
MELQRLGAKCFLDETSQLELGDLVPVFHSWIQKKVVEDHILVDVHNYSHVPRGPGILLVAHEGNFSMDSGDDHLGLLYYRKQPLEGSLENRLGHIFRITLQAARRLEKEPRLGKVRFRTDEFLLVANDRLKAPNTQAAFEQLEPELSTFFRRLLDGDDFTLARPEDPRERLTVKVSTGCSDDTKVLLARLS